MRQTADAVQVSIMPRPGLSVITPNAERIRRKLADADTWRPLAAGITRNDPVDGAGATSSVNT